MREPIAGETFDVILNLFTSLGYFADVADDRRVVGAAAAMLVPGGRFVLEMINGERVMARFQDREWFTVGQTAVVEQRSLDRSARRMVVERTVTSPNETEVNIHAIRLYAGPDVRAILREAGFGRVDLYGDWGGEPLTPESLRVLAVGTMPLT
jgi:SAM-dependent methyltransferase